MIVGIVMAGGSGKRLWPLSRNAFPKQFLALGFERTLLEQAVERIKPVVDDFFVSTGANLEPAVKKILPDAKLIVEPCRRDNAAAIGLCASRFNADDVLVFIPSDGFVAPDAAYCEAIKKAVVLAEKGIVVVGVMPSYPATGFGYIEPGKNNKVVSFKEKPDSLVAQDYIKKGFLWNISVFVCKAGRMMELYKEHAPDIFSDLLKIKETGKIDEIYSGIRKTSIDFAVIEKADCVYFVQGEFYWNDIGSFNAVGDIYAKKNFGADLAEKNNIILDGELIELNSFGNIVSSPGKKVALIDCNDLVVIDSKDALLVCPKKSSEKVKKLVEEKVPAEMQ